MLFMAKNKTNAFPRHNAPVCSISSDLVDARVFEIKKLVESVAQELAYLVSMHF